MFSRSLSFSFLGIFLFFSFYRVSLSIALPSGERAGFEGLYREFQEPLLAESTTTRESFGIETGGESSTLLENAQETSCWRETQNCLRNYLFPCWKRSGETGNWEGWNYNNRGTSLGSWYSYSDRGVDPGGDGRPSEDVRYSAVFSNHSQFENNLNPPGQQEEERASFLRNLSQQHYDVLPYSVKNDSMKDGRSGSGGSHNSSCFTTERRRVEIPLTKEELEAQGFALPTLKNFQTLLGEDHYMIKTGFFSDPKILSLIKEYELKKKEKKNHKADLNDVLEKIQEELSFSISRGTTPRSWSMSRLISTPRNASLSTEKNSVISLNEEEKAFQLLRRGAKLEQQFLTSGFSEKELKQRDLFYSAKKRHLIQADFALGGTASLALAKRRSDSQGYLLKRMKGGSPGIAPLELSGLKEKSKDQALNDISLQSMKHAVATYLISQKLGLEVVPKTVPAVAHGGVLAEAIYYLKNAQHLYEELAELLDLKELQRGYALEDIEAEMRQYLSDGTLQEHVSLPKSYSYDEDGNIALNGKNISEYDKIALLPQQIAELILTGEATFLQKPMNSWEIDQIKEAYSKDHLKEMLENLDPSYRFFLKEPYQYDLEGNVFQGEELIIDAETSSEDRMGKFYHFLLEDKAGLAKKSLRKVSEINFGSVHLIKDMVAIGWLDFLTFQEDRNPGNLLYEKLSPVEQQEGEWRVYAIDNGDSFSPGLKALDQESLLTVQTSYLPKSLPPFLDSEMAQKIVLTSDEELNRLLAPIGLSQEETDAFISRWDSLRQLIFNSREGGSFYRSYLKEVEGCLDTNEQTGHLLSLMEEQQRKEVPIPPFEIVTDWKQDARRIEQTLTKEVTNEEGDMIVIFNKLPGSYSNYLARTRVDATIKQQELRNISSDDNLHEIISQKDSASTRLLLYEEEPERTDNDTKNEIE